MEQDNKETEICFNEKLYIIAIIMLFLVILYLIYYLLYSENGTKITGGFGKNSFGIDRESCNIGRNSFGNRGFGFG